MKCVTECCFCLPASFFKEVHDLGAWSCGYGTFGTFHTFHALLCQTARYTHTHRHLLSKQHVLSGWCVSCLLLCLHQPSCSGHLLPTAAGKQQCPGECGLERQLCWDPSQWLLQHQLQLKLCRERLRGVLPDEWVMGRGGQRVQCRLYQ